MQVFELSWTLIEGRYKKSKSSNDFEFWPSQREPSVNVHIDVTSDALKFVAYTVVTQYRVHYEI